MLLALGDALVRVHGYLGSTTYGGDVIVVFLGGVAATDDFGEAFGESSRSGGRESVGQRYRRSGVVDIGGKPSVSEKTGTGTGNGAGTARISLTLTAGLVFKKLAGGALKVKGVEGSGR